MMSSSALGFPEKASRRTGVAGGTGLFDLQQQRVAVAIDERFDQSLRMSRGFPLAPQFLPRTRPIGDVAGRQRALERIPVHPRHHQDFARLCVLRDRWHETRRVERYFGDKPISGYLLRRHSIPAKKYGLPPLWGK